MKKIVGALTLMFAKSFHILKELVYLAGKEKMLLLLPLFFLLAVLAFLVFYIGPAVILSFVYAGV